MKTRLYIFILMLFMISCERDAPIMDNPYDPDNITPYDQTMNFLIDNSSIWTEERCYNDGAPYPYGPNYYIDTSSFYFDGDTILDRPTVYDFYEISSSSPHQYNKLHCIRKNYKWYLPNENPSTSPGTLTTFYSVACYFRQDTLTKRVYVVPNDEYFFSNWPTDKEYVLYDFNLNAGDTLPYNAWNGFVSNVYKVDTVGYIVVGWKFLKTYKLNQNETIIEGIGGNNSFLRNIGKLIHFHNKDIDYYP